MLINNNIFDSVFSKYNFKNNIKFFNKSLILLLFICFSVTSQGLAKREDDIQANSSSSAIPSTLRGVELYYDIISEGKIQIHIKKYFDYGFANTANEETISLQESGGMLHKDIVLVKESETIQENKSLQTPDDIKRGNLQIIVYSKEIDLGQMHNDYDITWGYQFFNKHFTNIEDQINQGITLAVHVKNDGMMQKNEMPVLSALPSFLIKSNTKGASPIKYIDDDNDKVVIDFNSAYSLNSVISYLSVTNQQNKTVVTQDASIITDKYPFKKVSYKKGFDGKNPIKGRIFSIDANSGEFKYQTSTDIGKYLIALIIKDIKDNKTISEHPCVFIMDVQ